MILDILKAPTGEELARIESGEAADWTNYRIVREIVEKILESPTLTSSVREASMRHANGFIKIVLGSVGPSRMRFHHWTEIVKDDPHTHRWDFTSRVLYGSFMEEFYSEHESGVGSFVRHACGRTESDPDEFEVIAGPTVELTPTRTRTLRPGDIRFVSSPGLHSFVPVSAPATTVVVTSRPYGRLSNLYRTTETESSGPSDRPDEDELTSTLEWILKIAT